MEEYNNEDKIMNTVFDILLDNEDVFFTVDDIFNTFKKKKYIYGSDNPYTNYWYFVNACNNIENEFKNTYLFYKTEYNKCRPVMVYSNKEKSELYDKLRTIKFKSELVDEYDIFGNNMWTKKYIYTVLDDNNKFYRNYDLYFPQMNAVYESDTYLNYILNNDNTSLKEVNNLLNYYEYIKDEDKELKVSRKKINILEDIINTHNISTYNYKSVNNFSNNKEKKELPKKKTSNLWTFYKFTLLMFLNFMISVFSVNYTSNYLLLNYKNEYFKYNIDQYLIYVSFFWKLWIIMEVIIERFKYRRCLIF